MTWKASATQIAAQRAHDINRRRHARQSPIVRMALEQFPGAEIIDVRLPEEQIDAERNTWQRRLERGNG